MNTVEFTHQVIRGPNDVPFYPGSDPSAEAAADYAYLMNLVNTGFGNTVNMVHTEDEFTWTNTFTSSEDDYQNFLNFSVNDAEFTRIMQNGYQYNLQNNLSETIQVVFKDENGVVIEEPTNF
jgi:hypothetical protein